MWDTYIVSEKPDARVQKYLFIASSIPVTVILFCWLIFAKIIGWRLMYRQKAFSPTLFVAFINASQVIIHAHIAMELWSAGWSKYYGPCAACDKSTNENPMRITRACHLFFMMKIFDLLDSVVFILRRNPRRITKTHIFQRVAMLIQAYLITKYTPGGVATFRMLLDCLSHVFTYSYYYVSSLNSLLCQRIIWWRHWLTRGHIGRWLIQVFHDIIIMTEDCVTPKAITFISLFSSIILLFLYCKIYFEHYFKRDLTIFKKSHRH